MNHAENCACPECIEAELLKAMLEGLEVCVDEESSDS
jgi:uncharacterized protein (DUF983 family)